MIYFHSIHHITIGFTPTSKFKNNFYSEKVFNLWVWFPTCLSWRCKFTFKSTVHAFSRIRGRLKYFNHTGWQLWAL